MFTEISWIPAFAGMTIEDAGMTNEDGGLAIVYDDRLLFWKPP